MKLQQFLCTSIVCALAQAAPIEHDQALFKAEDGARTVLKALDDAEIIPQVLPPTFVPKLALSLTYTSSKHPVSLGNTIPVSNTSSRPQFQVTVFPDESLSPTRTLVEDKTYVLALTDPDATSYAEPVKAQMCHWIATGVRLHKVNDTGGRQGGGSTAYALDLSQSAGEDDHEVDLSAVEELIEYMAPAPPKKTGKHRYVFVLLEAEDADGGKKTALKKPEDRAHWGYEQEGNERPGVARWAEENKLTPIAANFFYAEHGT